MGVMCWAGSQLSAAVGSYLSKHSLWSVCCSPGQRRGSNFKVWEMDLARTATRAVLRSTINAGLRVRMYFIIISLGNYFRICGGSLFLWIKAIRWWDSAQPCKEPGEACPVPHTLTSAPCVLFQCHGKALLSWRSKGSGNSALPGAGSSSLPSALASSGWLWLFSLWCR